MYNNRPQIDEVVRRQLLDNYLRSQQLQSSQTSAPAFHPSQLTNLVSTQQADDRTDAFSDISRISFATNTTVNPQPHPTVAINNAIQNVVKVTEHNVNETSIMPFNDLPENISIEDFSNLVKKWIEIDNWLKKTQETAKQKRKQKDKLSEVITHYMCKYNIEDLNTSEGKIRCKVRYVKSGLNQKMVKQRITELFKDNEQKGDAIISKIFDEREKVERVSLRRLKIT